MIPPFQERVATSDQNSRFLSRLGAWWKTETRTSRSMGARLASALPTVFLLASVLWSLLRYALPVAIRAAGVALGRRIIASPMTLALAAIHLGIFLALDRFGGSDTVSDYGSAMGVSYVEVRTGEWWRLFTCGWAHWTWSHVVVNCKYLLIFGVLLEPAVGSRAFGILYGLSTLGAGAAGAAFDYGCGAGSSGSIFGLNGALLVCRVFTARVPSVLVWLWAAFQANEGLSWVEVHTIGNAGHIGGLVTGMLVGAFHTRPAIPSFLGTRPRRFLAASLASIALTSALALDPQWVLAWRGNQAIWRSQPDRTDSGECRWEEIEESADPRRPVEAALLADAAIYRINHENYRRARSLLVQIAPTLRAADVHRDLGYLQAWSEPRNDSAAVKSFSTALSIEPRSPETMDQMAQLLLWTEDSTLFNPRLALHYARYAVLVDKEQSPEYLRTLAWARFACGERAKAVGAIRRALDLSPADRGDYSVDLISMTRASGRWNTIAHRDRWYGWQGQPVTPWGAKP